MVFWGKTSCTYNDIYFLSIFRTYLHLTLKLRNGNYKIFLYRNFARFFLFNLWKSVINLSIIHRISPKRKRNIANRKINFYLLDKHPNINATSIATEPNLQPLQSAKIDLLCLSNFNITKY